MRTSTGDAIRNRPIHELLYLDEDDSRYDCFEQPSQHKSSPSTLVAMELFQEEESEEKDSSQRKEHSTTGRKFWILLLSKAVILVLVMVTSVEVIKMGPQRAGL